MSKSGDNWKWWYFVVVGALIGAYGGYEFWDLQIKRGFGSVVLAIALIAIGLFSRKSETAPSKDEM